MLRQCDVLIDAIKRLPIELLGQSELTLAKTLKPDSFMVKIKISFWQEYHRAQRERTYMLQSNITQGLCDRVVFHRVVVGDPYKMAWLIAPPAEDILVQKEILQLGYKRLLEVMELPITERVYVTAKDGKRKLVARVNLGLIKEMRSITEALENRVNGAVVQRTEAKNLSLSLSGAAPGGQAVLPPMPSEPSLQDINRALKKLAKIERAQAEDTVVEGEVE